MTRPVTSFLFFYNTLTYIALVLLLRLSRESGKLSFRAVRIGISELRTGIIVPIAIA